MDDQYQQLLNASFRFISFRPRSEKEIRDFITKKLHAWHVYGPSIIEKALDRLAELGYVDDTKFVQWWAQQRQGRKPKASFLIKRELLSKGVARDIIEQVLPSEIIDQTELAARSIEKKLPLWQKLPTMHKKKKIYDYLARRGFSADTIRRIVDEVVKGGVQY